MAKHAGMIMAGARAFDVEDVVYLRHGEQSLKARLFRPHGIGPFPTVIDLHGGIWTKNDRTSNRARHEALARNGIAVASLDFHQGEAAYPAGSVDINYGIRWLKANPERLNSRADMFGISGSSSGGHLAMLAAMRPDEPRYSAIRLPGNLPDVDASVSCVVLFWPVTDPLGRHRNAIRMSRLSNPPGWTSETMTLSLAYWQTEESMAEGSPLLILERGEAVALPPALQIQETNDPKHDYPVKALGFSGTSAQLFADRYRRAGGKIELNYYDKPLDFNSINSLPQNSVGVLNSVVGFIHTHMPRTD